MPKFMRSRFLLVLAVLTASGLAWFAASRFGSSAVEGQPEAVKAEGVPTKPPEGPSRAELMRAQVENFRLRQRIAALEGELQRKPATAPAVIAPGEGTPDENQDASGPLAFPATAPEQFTPEGFERVALEAAETCGMGLEVVAIDCSEYPCIAWTEAVDGQVKHFSMSQCSPWREAFANGEVVIGASGPADGGAGARYLAWMAVPENPADMKVATRRARERARTMAEALGATGPQ